MSADPVFPNPKSGRAQQSETDLPSSKQEGAAHDGGFAPLPFGQRRQIVGNGRCIVRNFVIFLSATNERARLILQGCGQINTGRDRIAEIISRKPKIFRKRNAASIVHFSRRARKGTIYK